MIRWRRGFLWIGSVLLAVVVVMGASVSTYADLRIVWGGELNESEVLLKRGRMAVLPTENVDPEEADYIYIDCDGQELTFARAGRYWQGTVAEFSAELDDMFGDLMSQAFDEDMPEELKQMLAQMFGGTGSAADVDVRVIRQGEESVQGFTAAAYRVETGTDGVWKVFEELWMSSDLQRQVRAEVGSCSRIWFEVYGSLMASLPFFPKDAAAVFQSRDYLGLYEDGFPVRSILNLEVFGSIVELESYVVEVSRDALPDHLFTVPAGYVRVDDLGDVFGDV